MDRKDLDSQAFAQPDDCTPYLTNLEGQNTHELTSFVQNLLTQMQSRFQQMSDSIIGRVDEMGARIDDLEKSIGELISEAGLEENVSGRCISELRERRRAGQALKTLIIDPTINKQNSMSIFKKAAGPFGTSDSAKPNIFSKPYTSQEKPSSTSAAGIFSKSAGPSNPFSSPGKTVFQKKEEPGAGGGQKSSNPFQSGQPSAFKPTSPFSSFMKSDTSSKSPEPELKSPTMKPLGPDVAKTLRSNQEILKEIQKDHRSHIPVNNDTLKVFLKRMDNLYAIEREEGKESVFIRQNNGAYLSDGTLVNSVLRDWIKSFEHSHKLQKFTTLRLFDRYLFAQDFLIPNRQRLIKAIQHKNQLGSDDAAVALQSELFDRHSTPFHKFILLELRAIHQSLYLLKSEGGVLQKFKLAEYMKCVREIMAKLKKDMIHDIETSDILEHELSSLTEALRLNHWLLAHNRELYLKDTFTFDELITLLQIPYYITSEKVERLVSSAYYWAVLLILQIMRFKKKGEVKEEVLALLERVREDERTNRPACKKFLLGILEVALNKPNPSNPLKSLEYWVAVQDMLIFMHEEQIDPSPMIHTLVYWIKQIDRYAPLSYLCWQKQQNHFLSFLSYFCSLYPDVTERLQGLRVTEDLMQHFPVNFTQMIPFLSFMADYSFQRGAEPNPDSAHRVKKLVAKLQNMKLLHIQMNQDRFKEAFGQEGMRALGRGEQQIALIQNMIFSQIQVDVSTSAMLESAGHDSIFVLFQKKYSAWRILLQMGNVWCKKLNNPIVERKIIIEDTRLIAMMIRAIAGFVTHQPQILEVISEEIRSIDPEQYEDELNFSLLFKYLLRIAYAGCQFLPEESEDVLAGILSILHSMLKQAPLETIGLLHQELSDGSLNLLHLIFNSNLHKEQQFSATIQLLAFTETLLQPHFSSYSQCDTRYGEVLLWCLEAGLMRIVCSIQNAKIDSLEHYFQIYTSCLTLIGRIAELCCINPLRYPLVLHDGESEISRRGGSLASNLIQVLDLIPVVQFIEKVLDFVPLQLNYSSEHFEPQIWRTIKHFKLEAPLWHAKLAQAQTQALYALNRLLDLVLSALILKYPKHDQMQSKIQKYLLTMGQQVTVYTGVPCLESGFIDDLLKAIRLIRPRSTAIKRDQPLLPLSLDVIQLIGSSYKIDHPECAQPHYQEIERESVLSLSKILLVWELSDIDGEHQLTTLYPGSLKQSKEEVQSLVKKLTLIPQSPFSYLNTVQVVVEILNIAALTQPQFFKLIATQPSFLQLLIESSVKEAAPIQHSYTCFCLISTLLRSDLQITTRNKTLSVKEYTTAICIKISFFEKLLTRLSLKYSQIIDQHDFINELDQVASDRPQRYQSALNQQNFSTLVKCKIVQTTLFELLLYALDKRLITRQKVATTLQKAPLAADLQTSYLELSRSINAANFIQKNLKLLGNEPPVQLFEAAIKTLLSPLAFQVYLQVNTLKTPGSTDELLNAVSYPLFFADEDSSGLTLNQLKFQGFDSIPFKYGHNYLYDESELVAEYADQVGRTSRDLQKAAIIFHAVNYIMSLISLQGSVLYKFHQLCNSAFRLVPEKEALTFSRLTQASNLKVLGTILDKSRESVKEEHQRQLKYSTLFSPKHLKYFESLTQGSWGSLCQEVKVPQLCRLYNFAQRATHLAWLVHKTSQQILIDQNRYWRLKYPHFCEEHKSKELLAKHLRSIFQSFYESVWTPLDELHKDFKENRESSFLSLYLATVLSDLLSALFKATDYHSLYHQVIMDRSLFEMLCSCVYHYFKNFSYFYQPCLKLARNTVLLWSEERGQNIPKVKELFRSSVFKFLSIAQEGRPAELDQLQDELKLLLLYYRQMRDNSEPAFAKDMLDLFLSSPFATQIQKAALDSQQTECLVLMFEILKWIFLHKSQAYEFEREVIALINTYSLKIIAILGRFQRQKKSDDEYVKLFTIQNLHTTLRLVEALGSILARDSHTGERFWQSYLQSRTVKRICDAVILGCVSLFNTRMSFERAYEARNSLQLELQRKKFKTDKHSSQHIIKLRQFTNGSVEYSHLQHYNPNFFIVVVQRLLQLIGGAVSELLTALLGQERGNNSRAVNYFTVLWSRDDMVELERGELGFFALDKLEDLVIFFKYLLCKSLAWENEVKQALEELRAVAIVDEEVEGYDSKMMEILQSLDLSFSLQRVAGSLKKSMSLLETLLQTGKQEHMSAYGQNRHINDAFATTGKQRVLHSLEENLQKSKALLVYSKL